VRRIVYSSSGSDSEEALPSKKLPGARHGNDADVVDVIEITDSSDDDREPLPDARVGIVRLPPLPSTRRHDEFDNDSGLLVL